MSASEKKRSSYWATFAAAAYEKNPQRFVAQRLKDKWLLDSSLSDRETSVFVNPTTKQVVTAHRGTAGVKDIASDVSIATGKEHEDLRFKKADRKFKQVYEKYKDSKHIVTGHSLGGSLSNYVYDRNEQKISNVYAYNPGAGLGDIARTILRKKKKDEKRKIYTYTGDVVSLLSSNKISLGTKRPSKAHTITNFLSDEQLSLEDLESETKTDDMDTSTSTLTPAEIIDDTTASKIPFAPRKRRPPPPPKIYPVITPNQPGQPPDHSRPPHRKPVPRPPPKQTDLEYLENFNVLTVSDYETYRKNMMKLLNGLRHGYMTYYLTRPSWWEKAILFLDAGRKGYQGAKGVKVAADKVIARASGKAGYQLIEGLPTPESIEHVFVQIEGKIDNEAAHLAIARARAYMEKTALRASLLNATLAALPYIDAALFLYDIYTVFDLTIKLIKDGKAIAEEIKEKMFGNKVIHSIFLHLQNLIQIYCDNNEEHFYKLQREIKNDEPSFQFSESVGLGFKWKSPVSKLLTYTDGDISIAQKMIGNTDLLKWFKSIAVQKTRA